MSEKLSPSEMYAIELNNEEPGYYSLTPAILYHLTYIETQEVEDGLHIQVRKTLSSDALKLYGYLRQLASIKNQAIFMKAETIAENLRMSRRHVNDLFIELQMPFEQLGGKSLIERQKAFKTTKTKKGEKRVVPYHKYKLNVIWAENNAYMSTLKYQPFLPLGIIEQSSMAPLRQRSDIDGTIAPTIPQDPWHRCANDPQAESQCPNNNPLLNNNPPVTDEEDAAACDCDPIREYEMQKTKCREVLISVGADKKFVDEMISKYTPKQINDAGYYVFQQLKRKHIENKMGYLRRAIEKSLKWRDEDVSTMSKRK